jgi:hypothetical protein
MLESAAGGRTISEKGGCLAFETVEIGARFDGLVLNGGRSLNEQVLVDAGRSATSRFAGEAVYVHAMMADFRIQIDR